MKNLIRILLCALAFCLSAGALYAGSVTGPIFNRAAVAITGGAINGTTVGATTPAAGTFSTLTSADVAITGGTINGATTAAIAAASVKYVPITTSLGADVALNNTANYFDGPSINIGTTGKWFVSGTVTLHSNAATDTIYVKLWDGVSNIVASAATANPNTTGFFTISLSGYINAPAGNVRISVRDTGDTSALIKFNASGNSADSIITAIRVD